MRASNCCLSQHIHNPELTGIGLVCARYIEAATHHIVHEMQRYQRVAEEDVIIDKISKLRQQLQKHQVSLSSRPAASETLVSEVVRKVHKQADKLMDAIKEVRLFISIRCSVREKGFFLVPEV